MGEWMTHAGTSKGEDVLNVRIFCSELCSSFLLLNIYFFSFVSFSDCCSSATFFSFGCFSIF